MLLHLLADHDLVKIAYRLAIGKTRMLQVKVNVVSVTPTQATTTLQFPWQVT